MHGPIEITSDLSPHAPELRLSHVWIISAVAALGGLLFGYDWVVIGGAKPFYESYFHLTTESQIGWANGCALLGCLIGAISGGGLSDRSGRKRVLIFSAFLFTTSSLLTGWSHHFSSFIAWRIVGGIAIGLASNVSPTYIAEISPASWRGRMVSLNQLAIVIGILMAQIVNWRISLHITSPVWREAYAWRWMFSAVAVPSVVFFVAGCFIPESPRWLVLKGRRKDAEAVLAWIGGQTHARDELQRIYTTCAESNELSVWQLFLSKRIRKLLIVGVSLAVLQQCSGINILFNYAEEVYRSAGYGVNDVLFNIVITGMINLVFTVGAMFLVDSVGRRRLMIGGCLAIAAAHLGASWAYHAHIQGLPVLLLTLSAIAFYAMTLAPVTWILITEIFPNNVRSQGVSISVAALWTASFLLTYTFPILNRVFGTAGAFRTYGIVCLVGAVFVYYCVPEMRGRSLDQ